MNQTIPGQLMQFAEAYTESDEIGGGRIPVNPMMFVAIYGGDSGGVKIKNPHLYRTVEEYSVDFYLHSFS